MNPHEKLALIGNWFSRNGKTAVAFSGGVDSTFLLAAGKNILGENILALTVKTPYIPDREMQEAIDYCRLNNVKHIIVESPIIPEIINNPVNRCYLCKRHLFGILKDRAIAEGFPVIADGSNASDSETYRPGLEALRELNIHSPLLETGLTKQDIRILSDEMGLPTAQKPSYACLLTRLPYNYSVDSSELGRVEKAELFLSSIGFANSRVRNNRDTARIEIETGRITEFIQKAETARLTSYFHELGYRFITVDIEGYRSGSFDQPFNKPLS